MPPRSAATPLLEAAAPAAPAREPRRQTTALGLLALLALGLLAVLAVTTLGGAVPPAAVPQATTKVSAGVEAKIARALAAQAAVHTGTPVPVAPTALSSVRKVGTSVSAKIAKALEMHKLLGRSGNAAGAAAAAKADLAAAGPSLSMKHNSEESTPFVAGSDADKAMGTAAHGKAVQAEVLALKQALAATMDPGQAGELLHEIDSLSKQIAWAPAPYVAPKAVPIVAAVRPAGLKGAAVPAGAPLGAKGISLMDALPTGTVLSVGTVAPHRTPMKMAVNSGQKAVNSRMPKPTRGAIAVQVDSKALLAEKLNLLMADLGDLHIIQDAEAAAANTARLSAGSSKEAASDDAASFKARTTFAPGVQVKRSQLWDDVVKGSRGEGPLIRTKMPIAYDEMKPITYVHGNGLR